MVKKIIKIKTDYGAYDCVFEPARDVGGYVVEARGIRGAFSQGKNLTEAKKMIKEAIEAMVEAQAIVRAEKQGLIQIRQKYFANLA